MSDPMKLLVDAHINDLHREAQRAAARAVARSGRARPRRVADEPITIRPATPDDEPDLSLLAALDSAPVPAAPVLVAETAGELRAAISLADGATVADPFRPTAAIVELLVLWAARGRDPRTRRVARWLGPRTNSVAGAQPTV
jgi:hypothetical protein